MENQQTNVEDNKDNSTPIPQTEKKKEQLFFQCTSCIFRTKYDYFGRNPTQLKNYLLLEDSYVLEDPFSSPKEKNVIILGAHCIKCKKRVCKNMNCSCYFEGTYCICCAKNNVKMFPKALQEKINRIV